MNFVVALLGLVVALLTLLVVGLLRSHAEILRALHALGVHLDGREPEAVPAGAAPQPADAASLDRGAADVTGVTAGGEQVAVGVRDTGHMTLLAFLSTGCLTCAGLWRELASASARAEIRGGARLVIVTMGADRESPAQVAVLAPSGVTTIMSSGAWADYAVPGAPYFVLVDGAANRVAGEGTAPSWARVIELLGEAAGDARTSGPSRRELLTGRQRVDRADRALRDAGIAPGHASLFAAPVAAPDDE